MADVLSLTCTLCRYHELIKRYMQQQQQQQQQQWHCWHLTHPRECTSCRSRSEQCSSVDHRPINWPESNHGWLHSRSRRMVRKMEMNGSRCRPKSMPRVRAAGTGDREVRAMRAGIALVAESPQRPKAPPQGSPVPWQSVVSSMRAKSCVRFVR
eukprot:SAG11_NODE_1471_length_4843_cov_1.729132_1_plen_154_part_00